MRLCPPSNRHIGINNFVFSRSPVRSLHFVVDPNKIHKLMAFLFICVVFCFCCCYCLSASSCSRCAHTKVSLLEIISCVFFLFSTSGIHDFNVFNDFGDKVMVESLMGLLSNLLLFISIFCFGIVWNDFFRNFDRTLCSKHIRNDTKRYTLHLICWLVHSTCLKSKKLFFRWKKPYRCLIYVTIVWQRMYMFLTKQFKNK